MTFTRFISFLVICFSLVLIYSGSASAFSIREFLGLGNDDTAETDTSTNQGKDIKKPETEQAKNKVDSDKEQQKDDVVETKLEFEDIQKMLAVIDESQRKTLLADEQAFQNFIRQEAVNKSVLSAARANKVHKNEKAVYLANRGADKIIREFYLNQLITSKIPKDFPTDDQVKEYYENNKDRFVLEERINVWQIFLPITDELSQKEIELLKKKAESISTELQKGKTSFDEAVQKHSDHGASKYKGGYLGLVKVSELKPDVQKPLMALAENKISNPIKTDDGIHIIKRGSTVPKQQLELEEVNDQIKKLLTTQARQRLRREILKQAGKTYPVDINDNKIEEWRLKLRTNIQSNAVSTTK